MRKCVGAVVIVSDFGAGGRCVKILNLFSDPFTEKYVGMDELSRDTETYPPKQFLLAERRL